MQPLNERILDESIIIEKDKSKLPNGILSRIRRTICKIGERNANKRKYSKAVWEKVLADKSFKDKLDKRQILGEFEHPEGSQIKLDKDRTSHIISNMFIDESSNTVKADFDLLPTEGGKFLNILHEAGVQVPASTRAEGELREAEEGGEKWQEVVPESYRFVTIDATGDPSCSGTEPEYILKAAKEKYESKEINKNVACALFEFVGTPEALKLSESVKQDLQHQGCKHKLGEKQCTGNCAHHNKPVVTSIDLPESATKNLTVGSFVRINEKSGVVAHIFPRTKKAIIQFADCKETVAISECVQINEDNSFEQTDAIANKLFGKAYKDLTFKEKEQVLDTQSGDNKPNDNNVADNTSSPNISTTATGEKPATTEITPPVVQIPPAPNSEPVRGFYKSGDGELLFVDKVENNEVSLVRQNGTDQILPLADFNNLKAVKNDEITDKSLANNVTEAKEYFQMAKEIREANLVAPKFPEEQEDEDKKEQFEKEDDVMESKINNYLFDNNSEFSSADEAIQNLVSTFKISEAKAKKFVEKLAEKKNEIVESVGDLHSNYISDAISYGKKIAKLEEKIVALVEANVKLEDTKRELEETVKELKESSSLEISHITESENKIKQLESELKESNESLKDYSEIDAYKLKSLHEGVSKIKKLEEEVKKLEESKEVLRKLRDTAITNENKKIAENISLKENHKKEIIKIVVENKLEKSGLKLNKQTISLLENCQSVEEINQQIKNLQNSLRENLVNTVSGNINEIKVEAVDNRSNVQKSIDSKIEASLKNFGI